MSYVGAARIDLICNVYYKSMWAKCSLPLTHSPIGPSRPLPCPVRLRATSPLLAHLYIAHQDQPSTHDLFFCPSSISHFCHNIPDRSRMPRFHHGCPDPGPD